MALGGSGTTTTIYQSCLDQTVVVLGLTADGAVMPLLEPASPGEPLSAASLAVAPAGVSNVVTFYVAGNSDVLFSLNGANRQELEGPPGVMLSGVAVVGPGAPDAGDIVAASGEGRELDGRTRGMLVLVNPTTHHVTSVPTGLGTAGRTLRVAPPGTLDAGSAYVANESDGTVVGLGSGSVASRANHGRDYTRRYRDRT